jgi:hypothetical protein
MRSQDDDLNPYDLAKVAMIIEVLTERFHVLLDTALDGVLALGRTSAQACTRTQYATEGADA